jgi:hypothetical protein
MVPVFLATVESGPSVVFDPAQRPLRHGWLKSLIGQQVDVTIKPHRDRRSIKQNAWHWGVAVPLIASELGYDKHEHDAVHYALVSKCFGVVHDERLGELPKVRSSLLTTTQFSELMEWEVRWAATEFGMNIPLPGDTEAA